MRRSARPLLLAQPSAFADLSRGAARLLLLLLALGLLASVASLPGVAPDAGVPADGQTDVLLYSGIIEGIRHGGNYYAVAADALRTGGYPLRPFVVFRLPTLAVVSASVSPTILTAMLWTLGVAVAVAWYARLAPALARVPPRVGALLLLFGGMAAVTLPVLGQFHETWAGLFIALSLALRRPGHAVEAIAFGLAAALIRETAALYLLLMGLIAWREGARREAIGWGVAVAVLAAVVAVHAHAVAQVTHGVAPASSGWTGLLGWGLVVRALTASTALAALPAWLAAALVPFALTGWAAWRDPLAVRTLATLAAYATLLALFARPDNSYWVLMVAPVSLVGLLFVPDGLRDLIAAALDRRRITVTRVVR